MSTHPPDTQLLLESRSRADVEAGETFIVKGSSDSESEWSWKCLYDEVM